MSEEEVFDLLDGGYITKYDRRKWNTKKHLWGVDICDCDGDLASCYADTPEIAWKLAVAEMMESLEDRANENSEANEPTLSAYERN